MTTNQNRGEYVGEQAFIAHPESTSENPREYTKGELIRLFKTDYPKFRALIFPGGGRQADPARSRRVNQILRGE
jgi:hypothetical protein